jgi:hypothetical protein
MKIESMLPENYLQHVVVRIRNQISYHSFISKHCISLKTPSQILIDRSARLCQTITLSLKYDIHIKLLDLACNSSLLLLIFLFPEFDVLNIIMSHGQSKVMLKLMEIDRSKM